MTTFHGFRFHVAKRSLVVLGVLAGLASSGCSSNPTIDTTPPEQAKAKHKEQLEKAAKKSNPTGKLKPGPRSFKQ